MNIVCKKTLLSLTLLAHFPSALTATQIANDKIDRFKKTKVVLAKRAKQITKKTLKAPFRWGKHALSAAAFLWVTSQIVNKTPLKTPADKFATLKTLKKIEASIPTLQEWHFLEKLSRILFGTAAIATADTILNTEKIRTFLQEHCSIAVDFQDWFAHFPGIMDTDTDSE